MKIGIIGAGRVGGTIGKLWAQAGHEVFFSSRHPSRLMRMAQQLEDEGHSAQCGSVEDAARFGDAVLFAPPYWQTDAALNEMGPHRRLLDQKIVIDATNPFTSGGLELALPTGTTAVSELIKKIPKARIVKAYNTVYWRTIEELHHQPFESRLVICYAGNEEQPKRIVSRLIEDSGFVAFDLGPIQNASLMEPAGPFFNQELTLSQAEQVLHSLGRGFQEAA